MSETPIHIVSLTVDHVKRIKAARITPKKGDPLVIIGGRNDQGKSTILDTIIAAMGGRDASPEVPVQRGHKNARVVLELGDLTVRLRFTSGGGRELVVEDAGGQPLPSPQAVLDRLTGKIAFDAEDFIRRPAPVQAEILRKIVGIDFGQIDQRKQQAYLDRKAANSEVDRLKSVLASTPQVDAPDQEQNITELTEELQRAIDHNQKASDIRRRSGDAARKVDDARQRVDDLGARRKTIRQEIERLTREVDQVEEQIVQADRTLQADRAAAAAAQEQAAAAQDLDTSAIRNRINSAESVNRLVRSKAARTKAEQDLRSAKDKADRLNGRVEEAEAERRRLLEQAKFPVPGLSFGENGVTFDGLPFDQASSSTKRRVSVAIGAALNPRFRVMIVRDASLLDDDSIRELRQLAEQHNLQVWCELVTRGPDDRCTVVIEDGEVVGAEPIAKSEEPHETPAATAAARKTIADESADLGFN